MKILMVASEAAPFAKTGGLGDVISALPRALAARGHDVLVVLPKYALIDEQHALRDTGRRIQVPIAGTDWSAGLFLTAPAERLRYLFLSNEAYDRQGGLYGVNGKDFRDNHKRFALLSVGALLAARQMNFVPDVVHAHDWQAALVPLVLKRGFGGLVSPFRVPSLFTVHNLSFQGLFPKEAMTDLALPADLFHPDALEFYGQLCLLKAGLVFADKLSTVSPSYREESLLDQEHGAGLDGLLRWREKDLHGILNGADATVWNPEIDAHLPARYSAKDLAGKAACKAALQKEVGLHPEMKALLCGTIGRFSAQKGMDLLADAIPRLVERGGQLVVLGTGDAEIEKKLNEQAARFPGRVAIVNRFDDGLAHRIEGGSDLFLMPSRYEPCGLNQLYSLRYGTLPLVHAVGGLKDTIEDAAPHGKQPGAQGFGFRFEGAHADSLIGALDRARALYNDHDAWKATVLRAMALEFPWDAAAGKYEALYKALA
ncbi:MAG: glycogen synthase GlgA [Deltaproteobacteria bacterium]|nr:glycogen synthase GlgA [Deltaproteobacteria bacterium]